MISYAQNFEDVILERVFHSCIKGRYIDVGAYDPTIDSVTKHFYERGWSGVNVEPVRKYYQKLKNERIRDWNINMVCGSSKGQVKFNEVVGTGLSSFSLADNQLQKYTNMGLAITKYDTQVITLAQIAEQLPSCDIHFLKVDVEGAERAVLLGNDWRLCRPIVVVVESVKPRLPSDNPWSLYEPTWQDWEHILFGNGYKFALFDGLNRFYYRAENPELYQPLSYPANVTD